MEFHGDDQVAYLIRPIFQAYVSEHPHKIWSYMVPYLHFRSLKFPLTMVYNWYNYKFAKMFVNIS